ncbi:MAG TPA: carboxypeptidase-like regulatory domain-containing protein [Verrucomicrobiae bacterium]|jgi:hypothetical protein|nr:carboxypeptidase-like regulatory domain-containing protein [Verrucomicrobiae bacterium]
MPNSLRVLALAAVVLPGVTGFSVSAAGQRPAPEQPIREHNGSIAGKVIDASGKPVAKATVKLTDSVTQEVSTFVSGRKGAYKIIKLEPGVYTLQAEADGRQSDLIEIKVSNNAVTRQDLKLGPKK